MSSVPHGTSFIIIGGRREINDESKKAFKYVPEKEAGSPGGKWVLLPFGLLSRGASGVTALAIGRDEFPDPTYN